MNAEFGHFPSLDVERVHGLLEEELNTFLRDLSVHPVPVVQDLRSAFITWFAVFLPEAVPKTFTHRLDEVVKSIRTLQNFQTWGWYRVTMLDVALFALTENPVWLDVCKRNYSHGTQSLRTPVLEALAFVADKLKFDDEEMRGRAEQNLDCVHFYCEWSAALVVVSQGDAECKRNWLTDWLSQGKFLNPHEKQTLQELSEGYSVPNWFFLNFFLRVQQYVMVRLISMPAPRYIQGILFDIPPEQTTLELPEESDLAALLWKRLNDHPLMQSHIRIED